jgi:DNA repair protein RadC
MMPASPATKQPHQRDLPFPATIARRMIADRLDREDTLGCGLFNDTEWAMTLDIYLSTAEGRRPTEVAITLASGIPVSTAKRIIAFLVSKGDLIREPDPSNDKRSLIGLTNARHASITAYLVRVAERWGFNP